MDGKGKWDGGKGDVMAMQKGGWDGGKGDKGSWDGGKGDMGKGSWDGGKGDMGKGKWDGGKGDMGKGKWDGGKGKWDGGKGDMMAMQMMMMKGKGAWPPQPTGPVWTPGQYSEEPGGTVGIEGLKDAVTRACEPHATLEAGWGKDEMVNKVCMSIFKTAAKWYKEDPRHKEAGTAIQAQALLEEFTEKIMGALSGACYEKPWFLEIYLSESVALAAINTFKGGALFKRTVAPIIVTHVDEAIFRYREEERHTRVMWDAVSSVGIRGDFLKKANKHLTTSYESAHISAKYGTSPAATPELGMVQDFCQAWLTDFVRRAWDVLNNGISSPTQDQQIGVVTTLFQYLCDPAHSCLPHDLTQQLPSPPPTAWDFVQQAVISTFSQQ